MGVGRQTCGNFFFFSFLFFFSIDCLHFTRTCIQSSLHMVSLVHVCMFCLLPFLHRWLRFLNDDQREPKATKSYKRVSQTSVHPSSLKHTRTHTAPHHHLEQGQTGLYHPPLKVFICFSISAAMIYEMFSDHFDCLCLPLVFFVQSRFSELDPVVNVYFAVDVVFSWGYVPVSTFVICLHTQIDALYWGEEPFTPWWCSWRKCKMNSSVPSLNRLQVI